MQYFNRQTLLLIFSSLFVMTVHAHDATGVGYVHDTAGKLILNSKGECIRTTYWTAENALPECEGGMQKAEMDKDGDGVADAADRCPSTPAGVAVDARGCERDSDKDGVADSSDKCPSTAAGVAVDSRGCPRDADKDGVADAADQCPGTPSGVGVDAKGCPLDSDRDGIADFSDKCPDSEAGAIVDTSGCKIKDNISLDNVLFKTGTAEIGGESQQILDQIAQTLKANEHLSFEIAGHTDSLGDYDKNVRLSENRANAVRQYLIDKGIAPGRLSARGYGPDRPLASNDTSEGRRINRRVELVRKQ